MGLVSKLDGSKSYAGQVLGTRKVDPYRIMSDVYGVAEFALVWTGSEIKSIMTYLSEQGHDGYKVTVDADIATRRDAFDWMFKKVYTFLYQREEMKIKSSFDEGDTVIVEKGRTAKSRTGVLKKRITGKYGAGYSYTMENKYLIAFSEETEIKYSQKYQKDIEAFKDAAWVWERNISHVTKKVPDNLKIFVSAHQTLKYDHPYIAVDHGFEIPACPKQLEG